MRSQTTNGLLGNGWARIENSDGIVTDETFDSILNLRAQCASEFLTLARSQLLTEVPTLDSGQAGFTADGNESRGELHEIRSHLLIQPPLPSGHPVSRLQPDFYGVSVPQSAASRRLLTLGLQLSEALDAATISLFESLEESLSLPYGALGAPVAMGERLLRFQWYPPLPRGALEYFDFPVGGDVHKVRGSVVVLEGQEVQPAVRVTPHVDIGHWTWQVLSTDAGLRLRDQIAGQPHICEPGPWLYTNSCTFMELEEPALRAPVHWVDSDEESFLGDRLSISYFVHARPTVLLSDGRLAGTALFEELTNLGYSDVAETERVTHDLLDFDEDEKLVSRILEWESNNRIPAGFSVGAGRFYRLDSRGKAQRRVAAP